MTRFPAPHSRRHFLKLLLGAGAGAGGYHLWSKDTPFPDAWKAVPYQCRAPSQWRGKKLLFISDIHYGNYFGPTEAKVLNSIVQTEKPDVVLLGGDLAETPEMDLSGFFAHWAPGCPTLFASGNHDLGPLGDAPAPSPVIRQVKEAGVTLMDNRSEAWNGVRFIGLPSALRGRQNLELLKEPGFKLVLSHEPDTWGWSDAPDIVQLSGHTHAGQIRFFNQPMCLPTLGKEYPWGCYKGTKGRVLLVSAGVGCTGLRMRVNCPPEIWQLEMV